MLRKILKLQAFEISITLMCAILVYSLLSINRAFMIGSIVGILFLLLAYKKLHPGRKTILFSLTLLIALIATLAIYVKSDSSLGRVLIYKISWNMFAEHPFTGIGWGNFQRDYGLYQAQFFQSGNYTQKEFLLAGNTFYAFNDYWQFIVETGIVGALLVFFSTLLAIKTAWLRLKGNPNDHLLKLLIAMGIIIGSAALFTHVFEYKEFRIAIVLVLSYVFLPNKSRFNIPYSKGVAVITIVIIFSLFQYSFKILKVNNYGKWEQAKTLSSIGYISESRLMYAELYTTFKNDIGFLKDYNDALGGENNFGRKIILLKRILNHCTDNISYLKLADVYEEAGMKKEAELAYITSVNIVPSRFIPRGALLNFYLKNRQYKQANYWRNIILSMPVKVPSERIDIIKQNVKNKPYQY
jgi:hypothetical protein